MDLESWLASARERHLDELKDLLRIPSISTDPARAGDVRRCAERVAERIRELGLVARVDDTPGHPIVRGEWLGAPGAPTVLIYGHYDVQPPDPVDLWRSPPFEPVIESGNIVARGATDDKGQFYCHIKAIEAHMRVHGRLPVNVKLLIEGEEEVGSPSLAPYLRDHAGELACDAVVVSDTSMYGPGVPSVTWGLRGLAYMEVHLRGPSHDLHSGVYGGGVANPINALARLIAGMHDAEGRVAISGFYDNVRVLDPAARKEMEALGHDEAAFAKEAGVSATPGEAGWTVLERITARPTLDCNGIWGGYTGEGAKTVLPSMAHAKISCRLVPDQTPAEIEHKLRRHVQENAPVGTHVEVVFHHGGDPVIVDRETRAVAAATRALRRVWGRDTLFTRGGGSIPVVADFKKILGADSVLMGFGLEDDRLHSPNEKFGLDNYYNGIRAAAWMLHELAQAD